MDDDNLLESHPDLMDPEWRKHAQTDAWLGAKQDRKQSRKQRKRTSRGPHRRWWVLGVLVAILAVTTAAIVVVAGRRPPARAAIPETPNPTQVAQYAHVDLARPYANTPAQDWTKGIGGITSPAAAAIGPFKAEAVADAYAQARRAITAAHLEPAVLFSHDPKAYLALFAPDQREQMTPWLAEKPAKDKAGFDSYLTEIADGYHLLDAGPRTFGTLTAHAGEKPGELAVDAKYVVAFAFDNVHPESLTSPNEIVSFLRVDEKFVVVTGSSVAKSSRGLWLDGGQSATWSVGCAAAREGFLAPDYANPPGPPTGGDQDAPGYYDPKYPVPTIDGCH
ncbi:hypothetical protein Amsp01_055560 [Amycolatopsis sp. NBRC 101858]|uniref:hypothetical protein n=1 Tax=Amycolatopsis sp. NBRC 101858 TaxID=3032200 RepID=UPI0024A140E0|nr:hypothetical protein [Amycolatopsis sp. NBRC 101858]GLY39532.1 hypothetical protein Amsp01_055560 [Amycolatopsis sp. NBRC 101858]